MIEVVNLRKKYKKELQEALMDARRAFDQKYRKYVRPEKETLIITEFDNCTLFTVYYGAETYDELNMQHFFTEKNYVPYSLAMNRAEKNIYLKVHKSISLFNI